jgi:ferredoxin--NADP+ reductase
MFRIVRRKELAGGTAVLNEIEAPMVADKAEPGHIVILKANEVDERIQLPIAEIDRIKGTVTIVYMILGKSTAALGDLLVGERCRNLIGPYPQIPVN